MDGKMHGHWRGYESMGEGMPWRCGYGMRHHGWGGMRCLACGGPMFEPSKEEIIGRLEHKKNMLERALDHINKEIERLKEQKPEEEHRHEE